MKTLTLNELSHRLPPRRLLSHKGDYGRLLLIGGNCNMGGAIMMAAQAAVCSGTGLTTVATDKVNHPALHSRLPEAMVLDWQNSDLLISKIKQADVILIGCGLGLDAMSSGLLQTVLTNIDTHQKLILDGDAITLFARNPQFPDTIKVLATPHQKEWERLSGLALAQQTENNNQTTAKRLGLDLILKKHGTELYLTGTEPRRIDVGTPAMATGGMGDTLAGMIAGFIAQFPLYYQQAVCSAVYLHSYIAQNLAQNRHVVLPTDVISHIQTEMKKMIAPKE
ncbi:NAD(P)H-hydrate dehydratase [Actinobacillus succinogenes]|uniref:ADP-dependent (S)-NAD(P)H-hydrate dehydratase n=1 Tax=Actinobacillus succinogenes (strain ATCC 55618 / DSM 22257 / CCUG 43843 / 130Z) TaxID=339671 RepID=A6VP02_ACTSZ|nr:NAD(P)H-hydrate dehydratase [Actinobacillus succinogenes]ABR74699.1 carbohydrate kinase, YjeF related protein [Actinobacillus succinogenes 130Z]PHI40880.1 NAD(P)H-hydrate dehydratase [Actinobacillus succinogenes]